jgi:hypothetical protein
LASKFYIEKLGPAPSVHQVAASDKGELSLPITWEPKFLLRETPASIMAQTVEQDFFGGAIRGAVPQGWIDARLVETFPCSNCPPYAISWSIETLPSDQALGSSPGAQEPDLNFPTSTLYLHEPPHLNPPNQTNILTNCTAISAKFQTTKKSSSHPQRSQA